MCFTPLDGETVGRRLGDIGLSSTAIQMRSGKGGELIVEEGWHWPTAQPRTSTLLWRSGRIDEISAWRIKPMPGTVGYSAGVDRTATTEDCHFTGAG